MTRALAKGGMIHLMIPSKPSYINSVPKQKCALFNDEYFEN